MIKDLFQNITEAIRAISPSIFSFLETTMPYTTPMPIALISASSVATFFGLKGAGAFLFVYSLEAIGLVSTSKLVETIVEFVKGRNIKTLIVIVVLSAVVYAYITILVSLNVKIHKDFTDKDFTQALTLICYLPLIAGTLNGLGLMKIEYLNSITEKNSLEEKRHQEARQDKKELKAMKYQYQSPANPVEVRVRGKMPGDYKDYVFELLNEYGDMPLTEITTAINQNKGENFIHSEVKGTWYKYVQSWKKSVSMETPAVS